jgi:pyruvate,water dikinase
MNFFLQLHEVTEQDRLKVGGKGYALAVMAGNGMKVPHACCITVDAYREYVVSTRLHAHILMELHRKSFEDMRWEELWDTSLRVRHLFLNTPLPRDLRDLLLTAFEENFDKNPVAVRSSAPGEDASKTSFAGLHESYVNLHGAEAIVEHIRLVWASLWSDRALLYRQELGLDLKTSAMAVVVQEMVFGERSGVVFGKNPVDGSQSVIESVYGLNQGLVDGTVEPDQWILNRASGHIISHKGPKREKVLVPASEGVRLESLTPEKRSRAPLVTQEIAEVFRLALRAEELFGPPQDVEWTYAGNCLFTLQSRPITTGQAQDEKDQRTWYLSLKRSLGNLKELREKIEKELIPAMVEEAGGLAEENISLLSDHTLAEEIDRRSDRYEQWKADYWRYCIPFAHGMRLFGQIYNEVVRPEDPYEFMGLLSGTGLFSIKRNQMLEKIASLLRHDPQLAARVEKGEVANADPAFRQMLDEFTRQFGDSAWQTARFDEHNMVNLLLEMATRPHTTGRSPLRGRRALDKRFLSKFTDDQRPEAVELLDLARASYRLRDDDNIYLGKIKGQVLRAVQEGKRRIQKRKKIDLSVLPREEVTRALRDPGYIPQEPSRTPKAPLPKGPPVTARQLIGQPAGPGVAAGKARVIETSSDLFDFKAGEILVCDAVEPNMTFVVPLSSGIIERRGGMLIHGAIIAREYGLPCVTGVPNVTSSIKTGDMVTVDGYLGIVIIGEPAFSKRPSY